MSSKEVEVIRKMVRDKEREERRNNIVIKRIDIKIVTDRKEWVKDFLRVG